MDTDQPIDINIGEKAILEIVEVDDNSLHIGTINYNAGYIIIINDSVELMAENEAIG